MKTLNVSKYELSLLEIIRDEIDALLKSPNLGKSQITNNKIEKMLMGILPKLTGGKRFEIRINEISSDPFIMAIYPNIEELDRKSKELVTLLDDVKSDNQEYLHRWNTVENWILEIDFRILSRQSTLCVRTGSEFVALLCHEIGHATIEDPYCLAITYKKQKARMDKFNKIVSSKSRIVRKLMLPMFINTASFRIPRGKSDLKKEINADSYVPKEYRGSLISYIEDCILITPEATKLIPDVEEYDNDQIMSVKFSSNAMDMMRDRVEMLKSQLSANYHTTTGSTYHKDMMKFLGKSIAGYNPETNKTNIIMESRIHDSFVSEMKLCESYAASVLEQTRVTDRDLTILEVECGEVTTTEDKIYLIHTIYDYIEAIQKENAAKLKKTKDTKLKEFIKNDERLTRLNACRKILMDKNTTDVGDRYGVFVRYPKGYEG